MGHYLTSNPSSAALAGVEAVVGSLDVRDVFFESSRDHLTSNNTTSRLAKLPAWSMYMSSVQCGSSVGPAALHICRRS